MNYCDNADYYSASQIRLGTLLNADSESPVPGAVYVFMYMYNDSLCLNLNNSQHPASLDFGLPEDIVGLFAEKQSDLLFLPLAAVGDWFTADTLLMPDTGNTGGTIDYFQSVILVNRSTAATRY